MSMDFNNSKTPSTPGNDAALDAPMFAPIPSWERGKKRKGLLGRKSGDAAVAAPVASRGHDSILDAPMNAPARTAVGTSALDKPLHEPATADLAMAGVTVDPVTTTRPMTQSQTMAPRETVVRSEPVTATRTERARPVKKNSVPAVAIAAGVVALGGLAAAGWYASQPRDNVAALTPGAPGEAVLAPGASSASTEMAAIPPAPEVTQTTTTVSSRPASRASATTTTRTAAVRTRPAPAAAASSAGVDASATLPAGPQPYAATGASSDTSATSPATVNPAPVWNIPASPPPVEPAPPTSATTETPATPATPAPEPQTAPEPTTQP